MTSSDAEDWMWTQALEFVERADRLHRRFFPVGKTGVQRPAWEPQVDMFETDSELWIAAALPGVDVDQVRVIIDGGVLVLQGERRLAPYLRGAVIHRLEIPYGRLERHIALPPGRYELGPRELKNGCLVLALRKLG